MSELKTRFIDDTYVEYYNTGKHDLAQVYLKSEADKVIAELERRLNEAHTELELWRDGSIISEEHQKELDGKRHADYKRCLAMAKICENKLGTVIKPGWWDKWHKRWLKIADKFKEAK